MPDFSEILKIAVEQQDWQLICGLYTNITGEPLSVPNAVEENEKKEEEDVLSKEYSIEELKYQNQLAPQEQEEELLDKDIDKMVSSRYNDFKAPPRNKENSNSQEGNSRQARSEPVGSRKLTNVVGVSEQAFIDDMSESLVDPDTGESLIGNNKNAEITPRNKRKELGMRNTSTVEAKCSICKNQFKVSSSLAYGHSESESENRWKCNQCSTRRSQRERSRL